MAFDAKKYVTKIKGNDYLEVKFRLVWFREEHPDWGISTEFVERIQGGAIAKAVITDAAGKVMSTAHKMETAENFSDYLEKSETGAIGRALAMCGYGTQFTGEELDEGQRIVDAPVESKATTKPLQGDMTEKQQYALKNAYGSFVNEAIAEKYDGKTIANLTKAEASELIGDEGLKEKYREKRQAQMG